MQAPQGGHIGSGCAAGGVHAVGAGVQPAVQRIGVERALRFERENELLQQQLECVDLRLRAARRIATRQGFFTFIGDLRHVRNFLSSPCACLWRG